MTDPDMESMEFLREEIRASLHGPAWHGPALLELLRDVRASEARTRPLEDAHTIAELAAHCLAWIEEVTRRVSGRRAAEPVRGDWPPVAADLDESAWSDLRGEIEQAGVRLDETLRSFPAERLPETVLGEEVEYSYSDMLHGLAQHHAYHGGQIALLKKGLHRA